MMVRKSKRNENLTLEEKLEQTLVPNWDEPYKLPDNWCWVYLTKGFAHCLDNFRKPVNATERSTMQGDIPYYGATGQVGWINNFLTNEHLVLLGEDGAPFLDYTKDKAYIIDGKSWVNNQMKKMLEKNEYKKMVARSGIEPLTQGFSVPCSTN